MLHSQQIRSESHEDLAQHIQRDASILIERWTRRAIEEQAEAKRVHHEILLDHLPLFLHMLAESLGETAEEKVEQHRLPAFQHGVQRWENGWSLPEVIRDYQLLRTVLLEFLDESLGRLLSLRELLAINQAIDESIAAGVGAYVAHQEEMVRHAERERVEREKQAEEDHLRHQTETLREVDRRKDEFLAVLGHELRNPLAPLHNIVRVLQAGAPSSETLEWAVGVVERQVQQMTRLVDDLLDITRIGRGKVELRQERLDLVELVRQVAEDRRGVIEAAGQHFHVAMPAQPVWVLGDAVRLAQVVGNLLHNACKFTSRDGRIDLSLQQAAADGRALITVRDTGIGIEPAELPYLFETFRQAERIRYQNQGGLGLGLALVKGLIELHGGEVWASSAGLGQGAEFRFWLPLEAAE